MYPACVWNTKQETVTEEKLNQAYAYSCLVGRMDTYMSGSFQARHIN